jgi:hypothetical protein
VGSSDLRTGKEGEGTGKEGERTTKKGQELWRRGKLRRTGVCSLHVHERLCLKCLYAVLLAYSILVLSFAVYFMTLSIMQAFQRRVFM